MKTAFFVLPFMLTIAAPAQATGGFTCRTADERPVEVSLGFGHVPGSPLILTRLIDNGRIVPTSPGQWWLDDAELRLLLTDPNSLNKAVELRTKRNGYVYDGSLWRLGVRRWVRCHES